jgi:hypothetical protein
MKVLNWVTVAAVGIAITIWLAGYSIVWPALAIGAGAGVVALGLLIRRSGRKYYAAAGTAYCLGLAGLIYASALLPAGYAESPFAALVSLGGASALIVGAQAAGRQLVIGVFGGTAGKKYATAIYDAIAAVLGLLGMVWTVMTAYEKAIRYGGISVGGTLGFVLNLLGIELPIPWIIQNGVDASILLFVGCVLIGFHTLESLHTTWHATKQTAKAGVGAGRTAGSKAMSTAQGARDPSTDE